MHKFLFKKLIDQNQTLKMRGKLKKKFSINFMVSIHIKSYTQIFIFFSILISFPGNPYTKVTGCLCVCTFVCLCVCTEGSS